MAERAQHAVSAYGGLGAHGLDFGDPTIKGHGDKSKEIEGSFSSSAMRFAPKLPDSEDEDEYLVNGDIEKEIIEELKDIDEEVNSEEENGDEANYPLPNEDLGYIQVLEERFGHTSFREGQLKAVKLILEAKKNVLVVLATGSGKSLCY